MRNINNKDTEQLKLMKVDTKGVSLLIPREYQWGRQGSVMHNAKGVLWAVSREHWIKYQESTR